MLTAPVAEIRLRRPQVVPVGLGLHPNPFDVDEVAFESEQPLDHPFGLLVTAFTEVLVTDDPVGVDEVERRPVVVGERAPDGVLVVEGNWVVDLSHGRGLPHTGEVVLERELRRVDADDDQPVVAVGT